MRLLIILDKTKIAWIKKILLQFEKTYSQNQEIFLCFDDETIQIKNEITTQSDIGIQILLSSKHFCQEYKIQS
jgi:hypothetical protein